MVAAVVVGDEAPRALVGPLHRPAERARRVRERHVLGVDRGLHAEGAADVVGADPHLFRGHAEDFGQLALHRKHALARRGEREAPARLVVGANRRARLHRRHHHARVADREPGHVRRAGEGRGDLCSVAEVEIARHVARHVIVELRCALARRFARERHRGQRLDVELDRLARVLRLPIRLGHHARHRVADEPHLPRGERAPLGLLHRRTVAVDERHDALVRAVGGEVLGRVHREHARHRLRRGSVHRAEDAVRVRAPHDVGVGLAGLVHVVGIAALAAQQHRVFGAQHGLADAVLGKGKGFGLAAIVHGGRGRETEGRADYCIRGSPPGETAGARPHAA